MRGIPVQPGATGKPGCGKPAGRPRQLALRGGLAVTAPAVLAVALAVAAPATAAEHHGHVNTPAVPSSPAGPVVSGYRATLCVADPGDSAVNDTPITIATCDGSPGQDWAVTGTGTLQVNGKCLDIYRDEKTNKAPVELWTCTGGANQQWQATAGTLVNPVSDKCLDDPRWSTTPGTQLELYTCNGGANQQWKLTGQGQVWDLTTDLASNPQVNPAPDQYGNPGVWSWEYGRTGQQSTYKMLTSDPGAYTHCRVTNIYDWDDNGTNPFVSYNAGPTIARFCGYAETWNSHTVVVSSGAASTGGDEDLDAIIAWNPPVSGEVTVSATIEGLNTYEPGINWVLYRGETDLTGIIIERDNQLSTIGPMPVTVTIGQPLYLEIGADGTNGEFDDSALTFTIRS
jgi:Ricin-type beta-trefoil lectin domain